MKFVIILGAFVLLSATNTLLAVEGSDLLNAGGCWATDTPIPRILHSKVPSLSDRINQIKNGNTQTKKHFMNIENCLPKGRFYFEYRLFPNVPDANRIVVDANDSRLLYFTQDHYVTFYRVSSGAGCLATGTVMSTLIAGVIDNLRDRINQIKNGITVSRKVFMNREGCLPGGRSYFEYRLYPNVADSNRIIMDGYQLYFYFTEDHYENFYRISPASYYNNFI